MRVPSKFLCRAAIGAILVTLAACGDPSVATQPALAARRTLTGNTLVVTNTNDAGAGSLREAVETAVSDDRITFEPALSGATINITNGLRVDASTVIEGPTGGITIRATANTSVVLMYGKYGPEVLTMKRVTITGGKASGIAILRGTVQLEDCIVEGNAGEFGGGVAVLAGSLSLLRTVVRNNTSTSAAGGVEVEYGSTATIANSTINANSSAIGGGGIRALGETTVTGSTISDNSAGLGGGVYAADRVVIRNSTLSGNSAPSASNVFAGDEVIIEHSTIVGNSSGSSLQLDATVTARNSILSSPIANCGLGASLVLEGANVFSDNTCSLVGAPAIIADAKLAPLAVDGLTAVHHLLAGSPAIDAAPTCLVNVDQRGAARPVGGACDVGSVEEPIPVIITPTTAAAGTINSKTGVVLINGKVTCSVDGAVTFSATVEQTQKSGKVTFVLKASTPVQATCAGGTALWSAFTVPVSGAFTNGAATVKITVAGVGSVVPFNSSTGIRLNWSK
ncbi:right-handed parallel beta-helix repeat-containing protein [Gemmatimonas groenlandica]|uniref:Right-handed parallel beta-helix repeat-containing protein n=1 Tax=Gemmatimonas groenlandica TaxID=2732249 RepID=A0A6M4ISL2_9BACT|nr:right-handed parallel beta-helix repeat-containing protein [Gemmatimonas groenlandica]QJR36719.1 right-handed parallel beta-helix repeat-containing protein [Gemmatimonas groenlandica]